MVRARPIVIACVGLWAATARAAPTTTRPATQVSAEQLSREAEARFNLTLFSVSSPRFQVYADLPAGQLRPLVERLEWTYARIAPLFGVPREKNAFGGRLPVFMFSDAETLRKFGRELDETDVPPLAVGYFRAIPGGTGHLVIALPAPGSDGGPLGSPRLQFQYTVAHEMTHAFLHNLYPGVKLPVWLNEGIAEASAQRLFPRRDVLPTARVIAAQEASIQHVFEPGDKSYLNVDYYPVFTTLVRTLLAENPQSFLLLIEAMRDKTFPEALRETYGWTTEDLERKWREYLKTAGARPRRERT
jgi:hypothetical protein